MTWVPLELPGGISGRVRAGGPASGPVVVAHDGSAYAHEAGLDAWSAARIAAGDVPPYRLVLLDAADRLEQYAADPAYARLLCSKVLPSLGAGPVLGIGASLGALALLHAQVRHPGSFAGLFLQSGSFFRPGHDRQEAGFRRWLRIVRFTGRMIRGNHGPGVPIALTCGTVEENLANNRDMAHALAARGCPVTLTEVPGGHDWPSWRAAFDPHLTALVRKVFGP